jgi:hypothetical protein
MPHRPIVERKRKFLVVIDDSPECKKAMRFASGRASHVEGGGLVLFHVLPDVEFQHWMGVADRMKEEAFEEAELLIKKFADEVFEYCGVHAEIVIREGNNREELEKYVQETDDLFALFLGACSEGDVGPLVHYFAGELVGHLKCPVVVVPGGLEDALIDELV